MRVCESSGKRVMNIVCLWRESSWPSQIGLADSCMVCLSPLIVE